MIKLERTLNYFDLHAHGTEIKPYFSFDADLHGTLIYKFKLTLVGTNLVNPLFF